MPKRRPRRRPTGEEARSRILEAAVEELRESGPEGLRLDRLARQLGLSRQAILYHFGSREGLIAAVVQQALESLQAELAGGLRVLDDHEKGSAALVDRAFEVLVDEGHGRLLAWVALSLDENGQQGDRRPIELLARMCHDIRERDVGSADFRDTLFTVMLVTYATLGASVFEPGVLRAAGLDEAPDARVAFRRWLRQLLVEHLESLPRGD